MSFTTASSAERVPFGRNALLRVQLVLFLIAWAATFIGTTDRTNWFTENTLTALLIGGLCISYRKFRFSDLSYTLFHIHPAAHLRGHVHVRGEPARVLDP